MEKFENLGVIKNKANYSSHALNNFLEAIKMLRTQPTWKNTIVDLFNEMIPDFDHRDRQTFDGKMCNVF